MKILTLVQLLLLVMWLVAGCYLLINDHGFWGGVLIIIALCQTVKV